MKTNYRYGAGCALLLAGAGMCLAQAGSATTGPSEPVAAEAPKVRVSDRAPTTVRDARVDVGGLKISMPNHAPIPVSAPAPTDGSAVAPDAAVVRSSIVRTDGTIEVPLNTIGPGESLQVRRERESAERDYLQARADAARRLAEQPILTDPSGYPLTNHYYGLDGYTYWHNGYGWRGYGPSGTFTSTTTGFEDQLHGTALKQYSDAASAGTGVLGNMHQGAIREFGRAATPPIAPAIEGQQRVQRDIQKDTLNRRPPAQRNDRPRR